MHFFCVALFVMIFEGPGVDTYSTVLPGRCPEPEEQLDLSQTLLEASGAAKVQFLFEPLTIRTTPDKDA